MSERKYHFCLFTLCSNDTLDKRVKNSTKKRLARNIIDFKNGSLSGVVTRWEGRSFVCSELKTELFKNVRRFTVLTFVSLRNHICTTRF